MSIFNKTAANDLVNIERVDKLLLIGVVVSVIFLLLCRKYQSAVFNEIDRKVYSQQDYTIFVKNIPIYITPTDS